MSFNIILSLLSTLAIHFTQKFTIPLMAEYNWLFQCLWVRIWISWIFCFESFTRLQSNCQQVSEAHPKAQWEKIASKLILLHKSQIFAGHLPEVILSFWCVLFCFCFFTFWISLTYLLASSKPPTESLLE